jgi:FkbM family methyltransferase
MNPVTTEGNMPITLPLVDGTQVVVPDSLHLITPYVLREQQDWFEDEIKFLRRILRSGQRVIDIGANYGVYALSMARAVGPQGKVWAFEPASTTAALLAQSIAANGFTQVVLEKCALSSQPGTAQLSLNDNSELNELIRGSNGAAGPNEEVPLTTLDEALQRHGWNDIAVVKIDAEGEEANILQGGKEFFSRLSPLILYEIKAGATLHLELVAAFSALGYRSYRLVPGLDVLTPFNPDAGADPYLLNLFCCKADRAALLAADGHLVDKTPEVPTSLLGNHYWNRALANLPYGAQLLPAWKSSAQADGRGELEAALALFALSNDRTQASGLRFAALEFSFNVLRGLCDKSLRLLRLASLARVAAAYGARHVAVEALGKLATAMLAQQEIDPGEPFLVPAARFDTLPPGGNIADWLLAAVLEELERLGHYSSFYAGPASKQRLDLIRRLGFGNDEMQRRLALVNQRFGFT